MLYRTVIYAVIYSPIISGDSIGGGGGGGDFGGGGDAGVYRSTYEIYTCMHMYLCACERHARKVTNSRLSEFGLRH